MGDIYADKMAKEIFPKQKIILKYNPYFNSIEKNINNLESFKKLDSNSNKLLFLTENISSFAKVTYGDERYFKYDDNDALDFFIKI